MTGPRQAPRPRTGSGPRTPAAARSTTGHAGRRRRPAHASHQHARTTATAPDHEPDAETQRRAQREELSLWELLSYQLNAWLRDPMLTRALARSIAKLTAAVRGLSGATRDAIRRLAQAVLRLRIPFPRRLLLALLALALPLALLALLSSSDDERPTPSAGDRPAAASTDAAGGLSLAGVGMPDVAPAPAKVPQVRVAIVLDRTYDARALRSELQALGAWLAANHAPGTRVSVIDAQSARASRPARAADLTLARPERRRPTTAAAIRSAFRGQERRRLLVTLAPSPSSRTAKNVRIATRRGAGAPVASGRRSRVTIDDRRPNALAATVARAIMRVSGQREQR